MKRQVSKLVDAKSALPSSIGERRCRAARVSAHVLTGGSFPRLCGLSSPVLKRGQPSAQVCFIRLCPNVKPNVERIPRRSAMRCEEVIASNMTTNAGGYYYQRCVISVYSSGDEAVDHRTVKKLEDAAEKLLGNVCVRVCGKERLSRSVIALTPGLNLSPLHLYARRC